MIRVITTLILAGAVLFGIWYLPLMAIQWIIVAVIGVGLWEFGSLVFEQVPTRCFTILLGLTIATLATWPPKMDGILELVILSTIFLSFLWVLKFPEPLEQAVHRVGLIFLGVCYLGLTLPMWGWIQGLGKEWTMLALFPASLTDTFGFLLGKAIGRHKLAPRVSPNKTWEGAIASLFGATFGLWLANELFFEPKLVLTWPKLIVIGVSMSLIAIFGDLAESLIKRSAKVKDSSHLIPGHGGALDRLDALTFAAPFFYFVVYPCLK